MAAAATNVAMPLAAEMDEEMEVAPAEPPEDGTGVNDDDDDGSDDVARTLEDERVMSIGRIRIALRQGVVHEHRLAEPTRDRERRVLARVSGGLRAGLAATRSQHARRVEWMTRYRKGFASPTQG